MDGRATLSGDSGSSSGPLGFGRSLSLPLIVRKTDSKSPKILLEIGISALAKRWGEQEPADDGDKVFREGGDVPSDEVESGGWFPRRNANEYRRIPSGQVFWQIPKDAEPTEPPNPLPVTPRHRFRQHSSAPHLASPSSKITVKHAAEQREKAQCQ